MNIKNTESNQKNISIIANYCDTLTYINSCIEILMSLYSDIKIHRAELALWF